MEVLPSYQDNDPIPELVVQLATEAIAGNLLTLLIQNIAKFEFEVSMANPG
jgi:hypothetical protein